MSTALTVEPLPASQPIYPAQIKKFSYQDLQEFHLSRLEQQLKDDGKSLQSIDNHCTALKTWLGHVGRELGALVGEEFAAHFDGHLGSYLGELARQGKGKQTRKDRKSILGKWQVSYHLLLQSSGLPASFAEALWNLLGSRKETINQLARACGLKRECLTKWLKGRNLPAVRSAGRVTAIEEHFDLQPGTLVARLPAYLSGTQKECTGQESDTLQEKSE